MRSDRLRRSKVDTLVPVWLEIFKTLTSARHGARDVGGWCRPWLSESRHACLGARSVCSVRRPEQALFLHLGGADDQGPNLLNLGFQLGLLIVTLYTAVASGLIVVLQDGMRDSSVFEIQDTELTSNKMELGGWNKGPWWWKAHTSVSDTNTPCHFSIVSLHSGLYRQR